MRMYVLQTYVYVYVRTQIILTKRRTQTKPATPSGPNTNEMSKISIPNSLMPNFMGEHERAKAFLFVLMRDIIV